MFIISKANVGGEEEIHSMWNEFKTEMRKAMRL